MHTCIPSHGLKRSWHLCPRRVNAGNKKHTQHAPSTKTVCDYLYGWAKKMVTYAKISQKMVNPRDIAGNAEEEEDTGQGCRQTDMSKPVFLSHVQWKASKYFVDRAKQGLKPEQYYLSREIKRRQHTAKLKSMLKKYLNAGKWPQSMCTELEFWHMPDSSHPCRVNSSTGQPMSSVCTLGTAELMYNFLISWCMPLKKCVYLQPTPYLQVMTTVFSPSQAGLSAMTRAWVLMSWGESCGSSLGWVWIHPSGSISCDKKGSFTTGILLWGVGELSLPS